jgi:hypothetical protein
MQRQRRPPEGGRYKVRDLSTPIASSFRECNKERERRKVPLAQSIQNLISM